MRATTIRLDPLTKARLDRLQAELALQRGRRPSHADLVSEVLEFVEARKREFLRPRTWRPFTEAEVRALLRLPVRTGVRTSAADIDRVLYGGDRP